VSGQLGGWLKRLVALINPTPSLIASVAATQPAMRTSLKAVGNSIRQRSVSVRFFLVAGLRSYILKAINLATEHRQRRRNLGSAAAHFGIDGNWPTLLPSLNG
jgi:hypothetical protein